MRIGTSGDIGPVCAPRGVGRGDVAYVAQVRDLGEHPLDLGSHRGVGDGAGLRLEDDLLGVTRDSRGGALEQAGRFRARGPGQLSAGRVVGSGAPLSRKPLAPALSAPKTYSSRSNVVRTTTRVPRSFGSEVISRVASRPSISGIRISMSTTSGASSRASVTASAPFLASPTTAMSLSMLSTDWNPARTRA